MPGRQSHGRPLLPSSGGGTTSKPGKSHAKTFKKSRAKATAKALDAFALASAQVSDERPSRSLRARALEDEGSDEEGGRPQKRARGGE